MAAPRPHPVQLLLCHEKIAAARIKGGHVNPADQFCDLRAYAWCFDCERYICDIHMMSRHEGHDTQVEFPDMTARPGSRTFRKSVDPWD